MTGSKAEFICSLQKGGGVTIPQEIREYFHLEAGDRLKIAILEFQKETEK